MLKFDDFSLLTSIFKPGWELQVLLYGVVFYLTYYAVYKIIFRAWAGHPRNYTYHEIWYWYRRVRFFSAVVFAPLFEEVMFTWLAYKSFLQFAQAGQEGIVIIFVGLFFSLLHLPGDLGQVRYQLTPKTLYRLFKGQLERFFYSVGAYFIYEWTGALWVTITLHYLFNAVASICNFDLEDQPYHSEVDDRIYLLRLLDLGFAVVASYFYYQYYPHLSVALIGLTVFLLMDYLRGILIMNQN